jgi:hypothetical protein
VAAIRPFVNRHLLSSLYCEGESVVCAVWGGKGITQSVEWETGTTPLASSVAQAPCLPATFRQGVVQVLVFASSCL